MRNTFLFSSLLLVAISCDVKKQRLPRITKEEASRYSIKQDTIYYDGNRVAYLNVIEWEYYRGKLLREISLVQFDKTAQDFTLNLVSYVRSKHPDSKIEVKLKSEQ
jgi:hypothetical protein